MENQKDLRFNKLVSNLHSGSSILLSAGCKEKNGEKKFDLFGNQDDSVSLQKENWGVFTLGIAKAFILTDTLKQAFLIGTDSGKDLAAIYVTDEDRPISVNGNTQITGDALLPKAGIKQAYVEGKGFKGKKLVNGKIHFSKRSLPPLDKDILNSLIESLKESSQNNNDIIPDSLNNSFFNPLITLSLGKSKAEIVNAISGRVIIKSDTTIRISSDALLTDVIVFAPSIVVEDGFKGSVQLFATDSIIAGKNVEFIYPSCLGILKPNDSKIQARIQLGTRSKFSGILFSYEENRSDLQTLISLGKECKVTGEVFSTGFIKVDKPVTINGKVTCNRFIIQTPSTLYENYLIDIVIDRTKRSNYYLTSDLFATTKTTYQILKWLR
ncbi:hypothetical protein [Rubrolithibacter danxiaensis]|uniref:hypothetical protein n=1 Tax=Rubrolithibacter danxiaensis TaxID=3390805 RepID=UPI003BF7F48B